MDTDLTKLTANETMLWGLANLWKNDQEGGYLVRHGGQPVNDFGFPQRREGETSQKKTYDPNLPNLFEKAFPCLFPYGRGGIEATRETDVDFREHVRWALQYFDRRFRKHETFPFLSFGILQRREALLAARLQIQHQTFERDAHTIASITLDKLKKSAQEEAENKPTSDPAIRLLKRHVHASVGRIKGSDQS